MLVAEGLGKRFGNRWIFRGVSFEVGRGDCLTVLGHNGSGKSTLLRVLSGLLPASEGKVKLPEGDPRLTLGMSALDMALYPSLTVGEHLELTANMRGCDARTTELLERVGLPESVDVLAGQLSSGMKARVKMAMAIQARPQLLLLDEPGASLDESGRAVVQGIVEEQLAHGALLIATNDPLERRFATHELVLVP